MSTRVLHEISSLQFYSDQKTNNFKRLRSASLPRTAFRAPYSLAPAHSARYDSLWVAQSTAVSALVRFALASSFWLSFCRVQLSVDGFSWFCWVWWTRCATLPLETGSHSTFLPLPSDSIFRNVQYQSTRIKQCGSQSCITSASNQGFDSTLRNLIDDSVQEENTSATAATLAFPHHTDANSGPDASSVGKGCVQSF